MCLPWTSRSQNTQEKFRHLPQQQTQLSRAALTGGSIFEGPVDVFVDGQVDLCVHVCNGPDHDMTQAVNKVAEN